MMHPLVELLYLIEADMNDNVDYSLIKRQRELRDAARGLRLVQTACSLYMNDYINQGAYLTCFYRGGLSRLHNKFKNRLRGH